MVRTKRTASRNASTKISIAISNDGAAEKEDPASTNEPEYEPSDDDNTSDKHSSNDELTDDQNEDSPRAKKIKYNTLYNDIPTTRENARIEHVGFRTNLPQFGPRSICNTVTWTTLQRREFMRAITEIYKDRKEWLSEDLPSDEIIEQITQRVSGRTKDEVKKYFGFYQRKVAFHVKLNLTPIDKWFEACRAITPDTEILEQQLRSATEIAGIVLGAKSTARNQNSVVEPRYWMLYRYIACALSNQPLPQLTPIESLVVEECMQSLIQQVISINSDEMTNSLKRIYLHVARNREYDQELDLEEIENNLMHNTSIYNPLGINPDSIVLIMPNDKT